jgi:hypothetical protein
MQGLVEQDRGPGIAAAVILKALFDELVATGVLNGDDVTRILEQPIPHWRGWVRTLWQLSRHARPWGC